VYTTIRRTTFTGAAGVLAALAISGPASAADTTGAETAWSWGMNETALNFTQPAAERAFNFTRPGG
jgi:hypothetical protein